MLHMKNWIVRVLESDIALIIALAVGLAAYSLSR
jgi:hypothetical protein